MYVYKTIYLNAHYSVHQGGGTGGLIDTHCTRHAGVEGEGWWREEKEVKHYTTRHFAKLHHLGGTRSSFSLPRPWDRKLHFQRCAALRASLTDDVARKWRRLRSPRKRAPVAGRTNRSSRVHVKLVFPSLSLFNL